MNLPKSAVSILCIKRFTAVVNLPEASISPRLGGHTVANQPPIPTTTVLLLSDYSQKHELNLNLRFTLLIRLQCPNDSLHKLH